ncbi:MAG: MBL fold metallo-hydrolase, partial [Deltaproteobacteria bacterium]|nr:MBL fold metallo-hydrolase [Deltaproteobacteria bacterium]
MSDSPFDDLLTPERTPQGLKLRQSPLCLEPRGRSPLGFLAHARGARASLPERIVATAPTLALLEAAQPRSLLRSAPLPATFGKSFQLAGLKLTLLPAGHILGSAQLKCEKDGEHLIYTGDLGGVGDRASTFAEKRETTICDTLILRATYGQPRFVFPPRAEVLARLVEFVEDTLAQGLTPVVLAARLGGAQEAIRQLSAAGHPLLVHPAVHKACEVFARLGHTPGPIGVLEKALPARGQVVLWPYGTRRDKRAPVFPHRTVLLTGRAIEGDFAQNEGVDLALPLSDHAGFDQLVEAATASQATRVFTVHGHD